MDAIAYFMLISDVTVRPDNSNKLSYQTRQSALCLFGFAWYITHYSNLWLYCFTFITLLSRAIIQFNRVNSELLAGIIFISNIALLGYGLRRNVYTLIAAGLYMFIWFLNMAVFTDLFKPDEEDEE